MANRIFTRTNIIIFGVIVVLPMLYIAYDVVKSSFFGAEIGEACTDGGDCKGAGAWCVKSADNKTHYCTRACAGDSSCPTKWTCGDSGYTTSVKFASGSSTGKRAVNVCWRDKKVPMSQ